MCTHYLGLELDAHFSSKPKILKILYVLSNNVRRNRIYVHSPPCLLEIVKDFALVS